MPFKVDRRQLAGLPDDRIANLPDDAAIFRHDMYSLPFETGERIGTSTLFAPPWHAAVYMAQRPFEHGRRIQDSNR